MNNKGTGKQEGIEEALTVVPFVDDLYFEGHYLMLGICCGMNIVP